MVFDVARLAFSYNVRFPFDGVGRHRRGATRLLDSDPGFCLDCDFPLLQRCHAPTVTRRAQAVHFPDGFEIGTARLLLM